MKWIIASIIVGLVLVVGLGFSVREVYRLRAINQAQTSAAMQSKLEIGRAETKLGDAETMISKLNRKIQDEIASNDAELRLYVSLKAKYNHEMNRKRIETRVVYRDREVERQVDLPKGKVFIRKDDGTYKEITSMEWSYKDFRLTIEGDAVKETLSYKLHQKFRGNFAEAKLPSGGYNHYVEIYEIDDKGRDIGRIKLTSLKAMKTDPYKSQFFWFNPKLDLELGYGLSTHLDSVGIGTVGVSVAAYGVTKNDLSWRFLRIGFGGSSDGLILTGSPVQFNLGRILPLISNLWFVPSAGYDFNLAAPIFTFGLSVGL
jgi:hypothetical protein